MNKLMLALGLLALPVFAEEVKDKEPPQPTVEERIELFQLQRAWLQAQIKVFQDQDVVRGAAEALDSSAADKAAKYKCTQWKADFTCVIAVEKKADEKK